MRPTRRGQLMQKVSDDMGVCKEESNKLQIQKSRLGLTLAFLRLEQVKIEQLYEENGGVKKWVSME